MLEVDSLKRENEDLKKGHEELLRKELHREVERLKEENEQLRSKEVKHKVEEADDDRENEAVDPTKSPKVKRKR